MYGQILPIEQLPKDAKIYGRTTHCSHFFTVMLLGTTYYFPIREGSKTVIEKMGMKKVEDFVQDILFSARLQIRDDIASEIHQDLRQQINDGFEKLYGDNLFNKITGGMDNKMKLLDNNDKKDNG